jgi:hypothetical protein
MDTSGKTDECNWEWGDRLTRRGTSDIAHTHRCAALPEHEGLHACTYCGVVHLTRRPAVHLTFSDQPRAQPIRFQPMRGDEVERWLKAWRDRFPDDEMRQTIDDILEDYREHADTGTPLDAEIKRGKL